MEFTHFPPSEVLKPYIRHYYLFESTSDAGFGDTVFPSGDMEMIFNLGEGNWWAGDLLNPPVELWGQITKPLTIRSAGRHTMLGVKFFPHSAAYFFDEAVGEFNDRVVDAGDVLGRPLTLLYEQLWNAADTAQRI